MHSQMSTTEHASSFPNTHQTCLSQRALTIHLTIAVCEPKQYLQWCCNFDPNIDKLLAYDTNSPAPMSHLHTTFTMLNI